MASLAAMGKSWPVLLPAQRLVAANGVSFMVMFDSSSQITLVTRECAELLNAKAVGISCVEVMGIGCGKTSPDQIFEVPVFDTHGNLTEFTARGVPELSVVISPYEKQIFHEAFPNIPLQKLSQPTGSIDILIGQDNAHLMPKEVSRLGRLSLYESQIGCNPSYVVGGAIVGEKTENFALVERVGKFVPVDFLATEAVSLNSPKICRPNVDCKEILSSPSPTDMSEISAKSKATLSNLSFDVDEKKWCAPYDFCNTSSTPIEDLNASLLAGMALGFALFCQATRKVSLCDETVEEASIQASVPVAAVLAAPLHVPSQASSSFDADSTAPNFVLATAVSALIPAASPQAAFTDPPPLTAASAVLVPDSAISAASTPLPGALAVLAPTAASSTLDENSAASILVAAFLAALAPGSVCLAATPTEASVANAFVASPVAPVFSASEPVPILAAAISAAPVHVAKLAAPVLAAPPASHSDVLDSAGPASAATLDANGSVSSPHVLVAALAASTSSAASAAPVPVPAPVPDERTYPAPLADVVPATAPVPLAAILATPVLVAASAALAFVAASAANVLALEVSSVLNNVCDNLKMLQAGHRQDWVKEPPKQWPTKKVFLKSLPKEQYKELIGAASAGMITPLLSIMLIRSLRLLCTLWSLEAVLMATMRWEAWDPGPQVIQAAPGKYEKPNLVDMMSPEESGASSRDYTPVSGLTESEAQESPGETQYTNHNSIFVSGLQQAGSQGSPTEAESSPNFNIFSSMPPGCDAHGSPAEAVCSLCKNICNLMISFGQYSFCEIFTVVCKIALVTNCESISGRSEKLEADSPVEDPDDGEPEMPGSRSPPGPLLSICTVGVDVARPLLTEGVTGTRAETPPLVRPGVDAVGLLPGREKSASPWRPAEEAAPGQETRSDPLEGDSTRAVSAAPEPAAVPPDLSKEVAPHKSGCLGPQRASSWSKHGRPAAQSQRQKKTSRSRLYRF